jgi:hypothetical protein
MKKIHVKIGWSGNNYSCIADEKALNGIIIVTGKSLESLKKQFQESLQFHIEGCIQSGDKMPEWLISGQYETDFILEASALIHSLDGILTRATIARASGINEKLIGHYASGYRKPRPGQMEKIVHGIRIINRELASIL